MGVSTTHRINLSMWILIYSFGDTYYVWAACGIYKQNTRTYTQSAAENSQFQFCLTITEQFSPLYLEEMKNYWSLNVSRAVSQVIIRIHKTKVEYKSALKEKH